MLSNLSSLISSVLLSNPDIVCITETWLSPDILSSEVCIPGFTLFRTDRTQHGGGVAIYAKSSLSPVLLPHQSNGIELLIITVHLCSQPLHIACFYRPPSKLRDLSLLISTLSPLGPAFTSKLLLVGDFNVNVSAYPSPPLMSHITTITSLFSLQQLIHSPTHFSPSGSPSTIDLIFAPLSFQSIVTLLPPVGTSDHHAISLILSPPAPFHLHSRPPSSKKRIWLYHRADFDQINDKFSSIDWSSLLPPDPNDALSLFYELFFNIVHQFTPSKLVPFCPLPPWLPRPLLHKIRDRHRLFAQAKSRHSPHLWSSYRLLRNEISAAIKRSKASYFQSLSSSPRQFWSYVRSLRKTSASIPALSSPNSPPILSDTDKASLINSTFSSSFTTDPSPLVNPSPLDPLLCPDDLLCSEEEVAQLISDLPSNTSCGLDGISSFLLKSTALSISLPLQKIFNLSLSSGLFPSMWKHSIIVPIPKTSPPSSSPSDYRPISLLSLISKLLEKHIHFILTDHLFSQNQISDSQFGFLPNQSTTSALSSACHHILSFLDKATPVCGVFLDVRKAFDSVTHSELLKKLHSLGLPSHLINWLQSYLCSRSQSVRIGNSLSSSLPVSSGVPQGSILGPILFLILINEVGALSLSSRARLFLFADDILLLHPLSSSSCWGALQEDLNLITSWLTHSSLSVNPSKSKYMIFSFKSQAAFDYLPPLLLNHVSLEKVYSSNT